MNTPEKNAKSDKMKEAYRMQAAENEVHILQLKADEHWESTDR